MRRSATKRLAIRTAHEGDAVVTEVSDTGAGMSEETVQRVFEPFFTTKPAGEGTGLGLSVSYGIVEAHGGTITVESAPGRGTTFRIMLPISETSDTRRDRPDDTGHAAWEPNESRHRGGGPWRVLVVDDEETLRLALAKFLRSRGYNVQTAESGPAALDLLQRGSYVVMLCDVRMPGLTGVELVPRALAIDPDLAIVMLSAVNEAPTAAEVLSAGAMDYLTKPVELGICSWPSSVLSIAVGLPSSGGTSNASFARRSRLEPRSSSARSSPSAV
jgi:CheY-like chemotaxis protein